MSNKPAVKVNILSGPEIIFMNTINKAYSLKRTINPRYSLRAFAQFLKIDQSLLSKIMKGKKTISTDTMTRIVRLIGENADFIKEIEESNTKRVVYESIDDEVFELISDWHHFAILEMFSLKEFTFSVNNISKKLGIPVQKIQEYVDRLVTLKYLEEDNGIYGPSRKSNTWASDKTSRAKILHQKTILEKSLHALENVPFDYRDHGSVIFAVSKSDIPLFKEILQDTRRKLVEVFQKNKNFDEIYQLQISLFPLTEFEK